jgi:hypothetical protein
MNLRLIKFASTASHDRGEDLGLYCVPSVCASHGTCCGSYKYGMVLGVVETRAQMG